MERIVNQEYAELIGQGLARLPKRLLERVNYVHFFTGSDPFYAGLLNCDENVNDGRSYHNVWCSAYPHDQACGEKRTTIIIPNSRPQGYPVELLPILIVHELGHVLHETIGWLTEPKPVTDYAKTNKWEAFAEAFTLWLCPNYSTHYKILNPVDAETRALFRQLNS